MELAAFVVRRRVNPPVFHIGQDIHHGGLCRPLVGVLRPVVIIQADVPFDVLPAGDPRGAGRLFNVRYRVVLYMDQVPYFPPAAGIFRRAVIL